MSWFFGKKKNKESPTESTEEISPTSQNDDYILIEKQVNPFAPNLPGSDSGGNLPSGSSALYPALSGDRMINQPIPPLPGSRPTTSADKNILGDTQAYLSIIPFELNKELDKDPELDRLRVDEISNFISRIMSEDYQYDFSVEKGVINEMEAVTE
ncbi:uncharacterized protein LOC103571941 [Microplitis demolitor]|uniref:uncharacterized protein LOC103571941 n=1 Tax=Microplitis demolitor TaxID=69319 RepID=UPI0004CD0773|nr:uncharacterized protein LOC103571941 [Microplitis demolitor]